MACAPNGRNRARSALTSWMWRPPTHRSSETIGAIAAAHELTNPEKSLIATIRSPISREGDRTFRYAWLASGLDIVHKSLGQHEIATLQTTAVDQENGQVRLTTLLAHTSGGIDRLGVAGVSHQRDRLPAPDGRGAELCATLCAVCAGRYRRRGQSRCPGPPHRASPAPATGQGGRKPPHGSIHKPEPSAALRDQLIAEITGLKTSDDLALWAHRRLPAKNTLTSDDATAVEAAYQGLLDLSDDQARLDCPPELSGQGPPAPARQQLDLQRDKDLRPAHPAALGIEGSTSPKPARDPMGDRAAPPRKSVRRRSNAHLGFVAARPCLICRRLPCDAHHLKFAQPRSLGRKVGDEFTAPLCRDHHRQLHRHGNEAAWLANQQIAPIEVAKELSETPLFGGEVRPA